MRERIRTLTAEIRPGTVIRRAAETLIGLLFSRIVFFRGIMPFGVAYATAGSLFGFVGAFTGILLSGRDILRILTSCFMARAFRASLKALSDQNRPLSYFLFTLWGTMLGGLAGFFFSSYTPAENLAFMLNGIASGALAYLFCVAASAFSTRPIGTVAARYVCCVLSLSTVLAGLMSFGGIWENTGEIMLLFLVFCIGEKCSFFYTLSTCAVTGLVLCLFRPARISFFLTLFAGTLLSALLRPLGKTGKVVSCLVSGTVVWLCFGRVYSPAEPLIGIVLAGLLFLILPKKLLDRLTEATVPSGFPVRALLKRPKFTLFRKETKSEANAGGNAVCRTCPKRILCRTKYRAETERTLTAVRKGLRSRDYRPPEDFLARCIRVPELLAALRSDTETSFGVCYAKAFAQKEGELFCGDTATGFRTMDDRYIFTIADGMGSGPAAARQSVRTARVMETLTKNGLEQEDILKVLNRALLSGTEETVVGIDVVSVDLKNGTCELFKAGAAPTYVLRNGIVYEIGSETLPIGMLEEADVEHSRCLLNENDYLILVSDGVVGDNPKWLSEFLNRAQPPGDCTALADGILREAKRLGRNSADDITVLAVQLRRVGAEGAA